MEGVAFRLKMNLILKALKILKIFLLFPAPYIILEKLSLYQPKAINTKN